MGSTDNNFDDSFQNFLQKRNESSKTESASFSGKFESSVYIDEDALVELSSKFHERICFYEEENAKFETIFRNCGLLNDEKNFTIDVNTENIIDEFCKIQEHFGTKDLSVNALSMSYVDRLNEDDYSSDLASLIKLYAEMNEVLNEELCLISRKLDVAKRDVHKLFNLTNDGIKVLEKKVSSYENEVATFEKKYPWLKDPKLDLEYICKRTNTLCQLQKDRDTLQMEVGIYQGLKPDIQEALRQLTEKKEEYERLKNRCKIGIST